MLPCFFSLLLCFSLIRGSLYTTCCEHLVGPLGYAHANVEYTNLFNCMNDSVPLQPSFPAPATTTFLLMTYATEDIHDYASYSFAVNAFYAENKGYAFMFLSPDKGFQFYPNDERWNKVRILMDSINETTGWGAEFDYVCFLDADLVVLDMWMDLEELVVRYSWADMIASRDTEPNNGVINSGMIVASRHVE